MSDTVTRLKAALEGRYEVERELGEGGMATVYLAEDVKHRRKVALKVLKPELAAVIGAERFLAEIRTTANLQHPHILALFDSGQSDGFLYYVMPYIEGESLRERLDRERQLGVDEAVRIARDVAEALDYAHRHDVVHRDIKPENILLHDGNPVVADFGIALALSAAGGGRMTETGLSLGTPHYMSPEQATAERDLTPRSDVYSLASVLYEMLAGDPPHTGPTAQAVLVRILTETPRPVSDARTSVPPHVAAALSKALEKLPADRFESAAAFAEALEDETFRHVTRTRPPAASAPAPAEAPAARPERHALAAVAAVAILAAAMAVWGWLRTPAVTTFPATRTALDLGALTVPETTERVEVSPDGSSFAVVAVTSEGGRALFVRRADEDGFRMIDGTEGAYDPAFSPDGQWIVYEGGDGTLSRVPVGGGASRPVVPAGFVPNTPYWADDGTILFAGTEGLYRVAATGGRPEVVFEIPQGAYLYPTALLPNGNVIATDRPSSTTVIVDVEADSLRTLLPDGVNARYLDSGHLLYADVSGGFWAIGFDPEAGELIGEPTLLFDGLDVRLGYYARYSLSGNGTLVYSTGGVAGGERQFLAMDLDGAVEELPLTPRDLSEPRWSPDGRSLVYVSRDEGGRGPHIFVYDIELGSNPRQLTFEGSNRTPAWSPDGTRVVFASQRDGTEGALDLFVKNVGDDSPPEPLHPLPDHQYPVHWPSEDLIVFEQGDNPTDIWTLDLSSDTVTAAAYLTSEFDLEYPQVSPDGDLAAYASDEGASALTSAESNRQVFVRAFPEPGAGARVSGAGGRFPRWSPDGTTIYYWVGTNLFAARVRRGPPFVVARTDTVLSLTGIRGGGTTDDWDLHPDGDRLVVTRPVSTTDPGREVADPDRILVVTNWFDEFTRLMGGGF